MRSTLKDIFLFGRREDSQVKSLFKALANPEYSTIESARLLERFPEDNNIYALLNATTNFLMETELNTEKFKFADTRNKNETISTRHCQDELTTIGNALLTAKDTLRKNPLKQSELNDAIGYCETAIRKRLEALGPDDKYKAAYQNPNELKSALEPVGQKTIRRK